MSFRQALSEVNIREGSNPGLVLDKYLDVEEKSRAPSLQKAQANLLQVSDLYSFLYKRWESSLKDNPKTICATDFNRLLIGAGQTVFETSLRLQSIYGIPFIPGSALKGVASNYALKLGRDQPEFAEDGQYYTTIFGSQNKQGLIVFHEAWLRPKSLENSILLDIVTVHYPEYYRMKFDQINIESDSPNPISFLSVEGEFMLAVEPVVKTPEAFNWANLALKLLVEAVKEVGVGAKTSAGYGLLYEKNSSQEVRQKPNVPSQKYTAGNVVKVKRVEDPKGKGRPWFSLLDGSLSGKLLDKSFPNIELGGEIELTIDSCNYKEKYANFKLK